MANQSGFSRTNFSKSNQFDGGLIHSGVSRFRVVGSGSLQLFMNSLDEVHTAQLPSITMAAATNIEPTILSNFIDQRISLEFKTTFMGEFFTITRITVFVKQVATSIPQ